MLFSLLQFAVLTALIVAVAKYLLYVPAKRISDRLAFSTSASGQMLGYLTSAPELVASIAVASAGFMNAVAYNILSSNVINVVLAVAAATWYRQAGGLFSRGLWREHLIVAISIAVPLVLLLTGQVESAWLIPVFLVAYVAYLGALRKMSSPEVDGGETANEQSIQGGGSADDATKRGLPTAAYVALNGAVIVAALVSLYFLGSGLGSTVHELGTTFGVPEIILGVAIGVVTSLPELTTFFASYSWHARRGSAHAGHEVTHNLLASNVSNLLIVQTVGLAAFLLLAA